MKPFIKKCIPPIVFDLKNNFQKSKYGWFGDYPSWNNAKDKSIGYDAENILIRVKNSILKVKNGESVFERDSVLFDKIEYSWPLLSSILLSAISNQGKVNLIDFGGSLGSTYYQNKKFLDKIKDVKWNVVEQPNFVQLGLNEIKDNRLNFFFSIAECLSNTNPNAIIFSSVLQYFETPYELLDNIISYKFEYIIIDRTPFSSEGRDIVKLQVVSPEIYEASYPCWFFNEVYLKKYFEKHHYKLIEEFDAIDGKNKDYYFKGFIYKWEK